MYYLKFNTIIRYVKLLIFSIYHSGVTISYMIRLIPLENFSFCFNGNIFHVLLQLAKY